MSVRLVSTARACSNPAQRRCARANYCRVRFALIPASGATVIETWVLQWIDEHRELALLLVPVLAFAESCIGIGIFVSGLFLVVVSSLIYSNAIAPLEWIVVLAFCGATLGDHLGYYVGIAIGPRLHQWGFVQKYRGKLDRAEAMIRKYGWFAILIGRFVPAIRSMIPAALGISGFGHLRYSLVDISACLLWALALGLIVAGVDLF